VLIEEGRLTARATAWFLRSPRLAEPMEDTFKRFMPAVRSAARSAGERGGGVDEGGHLDRGRRAGASGAAHRQRRGPVRRARCRRGGRERAAERGRGRRGPCRGGGRLGLGRLRQQIDALPADSHWQSLAKGALADDLGGLQRRITQAVVATGEGEPAALLAAWEAGNAGALGRAQRLLTDLGESKAADLAMLSVALRELRSLA
jgi:glutamate dehydrogenase